MEWDRSSCGLVLELWFLLIFLASLFYQRCSTFLLHIQTVSHWLGSILAFQYLEESSQCHQNGHELGDKRIYQSLYISLFFKENLRNKVNLTVGCSPHLFTWFQYLTCISLRCPVRWTYRYIKSPSDFREFIKMDLTLRVILSLIIIMQKHTNTMKRTDFTLLFLATFFISHIIT